MLVIPRSVASAAPAQEAVNQAELKRQLDLPAADSYHDGLLTQLIRAAREQVEHDTGQVGFSTTYVLKLDGWPAAHIELDRRPLISVASIQYVDVDGNTQTLSSSDYVADTARELPAIWRAYNVTWPALRSIENNVTVTYTAGYATVAAIPALFKQAVLLAAAREFLDRQGTVNRFGDAYDAIVSRLGRASYP